MFEWLADTIGDSGYLGIALLMLAENVFPPIPSELIMPLAGFAAADGRLNLALAVLAGSAGSLAGAVFWYAVGRWLGLVALKRFAAHHGRWLTLTPAEIDRADDWFDRHGGKAVLIGRMVPAVRTLISVPAGLTHMRAAPFLIYSTIGTLIWSSALATAGFLLGSDYHRVADILEPVSAAIVAIAVLVYLYRVATWRRAG